MYVIGRKQESDSHRRANLKYKRNNREKLRLKDKEYRERIKLKVYNHYTHNDIKCKICGFKEIHALSIDHINNNGAYMRKNKIHGLGRDFYVWIIKNNYPDDLQVLCMNCQFIKRSMA